jgi:hypothetical protein
MSNINNKEFNNFLVEIKDNITKIIIMVRFCSDL